MVTSDGKRSSRLLVLSGLSTINRDNVADHLARLGWRVINKDKDCVSQCKSSLVRGQDVVVNISSCNASSPDWQALSRSCNATSIAVQLQDREDSCQIPGLGCQHVDSPNFEGFDEFLQASTSSDLEDLWRHLGYWIGSNDRNLLCEGVKANSNSKGQPQRRRSYEPIQLQTQNTALPQHSIPQKNTVRHYDGQTERQGFANGNGASPQVVPKERSNKAQMPLHLDFAKAVSAKKELKEDAKKAREMEESLKRQLKIDKDGAVGIGTPLDLQLGNKKPVILFDLNGTLTTHTHARRDAGHNMMRPGIHHLRRLLEAFNIGIFTSASRRTVTQVKDMLEAAAGPGEPLFGQAELILHRIHTIAASAVHMAGGGNDWDTAKPLGRYFSSLGRVLLVDDDEFKACKGEEKNMILMPRWEMEPHDDCIEQLVNALLAVTNGMDEHTDLRQYSKTVSGSISKAVSIA